MQWKKDFSILLVFCMVLSFMPASAFAEGGVTGDVYIVQADTTEDTGIVEAAIAETTGEAPEETTGEEPGEVTKGTIAEVTEDQEALVFTAEEDAAEDEASDENQPIPVTADMDTNWAAGTYEVTGDVTIDGRITVLGKVTLNLTSGKLTAVHGIYVPDGSELEIFGSGELFAEGYQGNAAIGGNSNAKAGIIYIGGGVITANGGSNAAGIGGGSGMQDPFTSISIANANVTATGWDDGSAIGNGGTDSHKGSVSIASGMKLYAGNDGENFTVPSQAGNRSTHCYEYKNVRIEACDHPNHTYTSTRTGHTQTCEYCAKDDFKEEAHTYTAHGTTCTVCGYHLTDVYVTVVIGEREMEPISVSPYSTDNTLPYTGEIPAPEGKIFIGWDVNGETKQPGDPYEVDTAELRITALYADKITVTFDGNSGRLCPEDASETYLTYAVDLAKGTRYTIPDLKPYQPAIDEEPPVFQGWMIGDDRELKQAGYAFDVNEDVTLTAVWGVYTVAFDTKGGSAVENQTVFRGETVVKPEDPTRKDFSFRAWQLNGKDYDFIIPVTGDLTLTALWAGHITAPENVIASVNDEAVAEALAGETVKLSVQASAGQTVRELSVKYGEQELELTKVNETTYTFTMPEGPVSVALTMDMSPWASLQQELLAGGTVTLTGDLTATADDVALVIPTGKSVTLDLAGHTLSRGLDDAKEDGNVITVSGSLTITDSATGGTITGGNNTGNGGVVLAEGGSLTLQGGEISGNTANWWPGRSRIP